MLLLKKERHELFPLHVNYGHLAEDREWLACQRICKYLQLIDPVKIDVTGIAKIPSGLTNPNLDIERDAFLPTRNLLFATIGAAYAYSITANVVAMGLLANPVFPDQTEDFVRVAENCITTALGRQVKILTPFITLDKREIILLATKHNLPLDVVYYCHSGKEKPCGICVSCKERIMAEQALEND